MLDEFAAALERFQGMTADEFLADKAPMKAYLHTGSDEAGREPRVLHVGVGHPSLMLISILNDCGLKAYVGPSCPITR